MIDEDERPEGEGTPDTPEDAASEQAAPGPDDAGAEAGPPAPEAAGDAPGDDAPADAVTPAGDAPDEPVADTSGDPEPAGAGTSGEPEPAGAAEVAAAVDEERPAGEPTPVEPAAEGGGAAAVQASAPDSEQAAAGEAEQRPAGSRGRGAQSEQREEAIPGAHLEPDLVLEETAPTEGDPFAQYREGDESAAAPAADADAAPAGDDAAPAPAPRTTVSLAADARYQATGKRKTSVARVILKPGDGTYTINGRPLAEFFPRPALQVMARQALDTAGYQGRMDVVARIHGGGVASQAGALRHGVARALVEADPNLRTDLKRQGFLTRDARVKERRKAGLKKARKKPQFSKR